MAVITLAMRPPVQLSAEPKVFLLRHKSSLISLLAGVPCSPRLGRGRCMRSPLLSSPSLLPSMCCAHAMPASMRSWSGASAHVCRPSPTVSKRERRAPIRQRPYPSESARRRSRQSGRASVIFLRSKAAVLAAVFISRTAQGAGWLLQGSDKARVRLFCSGKTRSCNAFCTTLQGRSD